METLNFFLILLIFFYALDTNSKVKILHRKIYHEDKEEKQKIFKILNQNIGETIQIKIKESYEEYGQIQTSPFDTLAHNEVKILDLNKDWVYLEVYGKQVVKKIIRIESIASVNVG